MEATKPFSQATCQELASYLAKHSSEVREDRPVFQEFLKYPPSPKEDELLEQVAAGWAEQYGSRDSKASAS